MWRVIESDVDLSRADKLSKSRSPADTGSDLHQGWTDAGYFEADSSSSRPTHSITLPPPSVTGQLHMDHALDHTLMDALVHRKYMQDYKVLWLLGMDHAGITAQTKVEAMLKDSENKDRLDYGREEFVEKIWGWKYDYGGCIGNQMCQVDGSLD